MLSPRKSRGFRPTPFIASEIKRFSKTNSFVLAAWAFFYLVSIFLLGYLSLRIHAELGTAASIIPFLLIAVAIARQQRALENLVHSASHFEFSRKNKKLNDFLGNVLAAFPVANIVEDYRKGHFLHHRAYNSELDPCKKRYQALGIKLHDETSASSLFLDICQAYPHYALGFYRAVGSDIRALSYFAFWHILFAILPLLAVTDLPGALSAWAVVWLVPMIFILPMLRIIGELNEHIYVDGAAEFSSTINNVGWVHELIFHPWQDGYHLVHHLFPGVPNLKLAELHDLLLENDPRYKTSLIRRKFLVRPEKIE